VYKVNYYQNIIACT